MSNKNDRLAMIKAASKKINDKKGSKTIFMVKVQAKCRKAIKNATEDDRVNKSLEAFDEAFMYDSARSVDRIWRASGVVDTYRDTIRYDNEWD